MSADAVKVANAALTDIGRDPTVRRRGDIIEATNTPDAYRAIVLGIIAEHGPDQLIRCSVCAVGGADRRIPYCTPARDALRGVTCGAAVPSPKDPA